MLKRNGHGVILWGSVPRTRAVIGRSIFDFDFGVYSGGHRVMRGVR